MHFANRVFQSDDLKFVELINTIHVKTEREIANLLETKVVGQVFAETGVLAGPLKLLQEVLLTVPIAIEYVIAK